MNIQLNNLDTSSSSPSTSPTGLRKENPLRRTKRSISVKKIDSHVQHVQNQKRMSLNLDEGSPKINLKDAKFRRVENIAGLRNIHECLMTIFNSSNKKIVLNQGNLSAIPSKENVIFGQEVNVAVVEYIYHRILRAMTAQIYYFFDDKGYSVTLKDLDKMAQKIYGEPISLVKEIKHDLVDYYGEKSIFLWDDQIANECEFIEMIKELPFPEMYNVGELKKNQKLCIAFFQRMYPLRNVVNEENEKIPVMAPITFLCSYKDMVTTRELFEQAFRVMLLPDKEMPYVQKLRVLNFIRIFFSSHLHEDEKMPENVVDLVKKIGTCSQESLKPEFMDLYNEILMILEEKESFFQNGLKNEELIPNYKVEAFLALSPAKLGNYPEFLNYLTDNLKYLAGQAVSNLNQVSLFKEKSLNEDSIYYMQVVNFGVRHFINIFESDMKGLTPSKTVKRKLNTFFEHFIAISYDLAKKNDYLTSFAFYNVLNIAEISGLLSVDTQKHNNKNSFSKAKNNVYLLNHGTEEKLQELQELFLMSKNFENLRKKMKECQDAKIYHVPLFAPLKNILLHKIESIDSSFPEDNMKMNNEKLHMIADEKWEVNSMLQSIKKEFKQQKISMHTDIGYHLLVDEKYSEKKLIQIYRNLKDILAS